MNMSERIWAAALRAQAIETDALSKGFSSLDRVQFERAVDALAKAPRIATSGCGHTGIVCMHMAHLLCCIERPARFLSPSEAIHGGMGYLLPGDVMVLASRGGKTAELLPILAFCGHRGVTTIAVTENAASPLAQGSDIVLLLSITKEADPFNSQGTSSFTVTSVLFDALQSALIEVTGFHTGQFAKTHPGGAVGERLKREHQGQ